MVNLENLFKQNGFVLVKKKTKAYQLIFNCDYCIEVEPKYGDWEEDYALNILITNKRFGAFLNKLARNTSANTYSSISYVRNSSGPIGSGQALIETDDEPYFCSASGAIPICGFINHLNNMTKASELYDILYSGNTKKLLAIFEGVWVQLFLLFEMGKSHEEIIQTFKNNPSDVLKADKKDFDLKGLAEFAIQYENIKEVN